MLDSESNSVRISAPAGTEPARLGFAPGCCLSAESPEIKIGWGGPRPGAGRKPKPQVQIAYAPDLPRWCVVAYRGQAEVPGTRELTRQGYETYLPMVAIQRRDRAIASMLHTVRVPLLSGYGFVRLAPSESREPITATRGVREVLLRPDGRAAYVPDVEIDLLRADDDRRLLLPKERAEPLGVDVSVRVAVGAYSSLPGRVVECDGVKTRVAAEMFGRLVHFWLDRSAVEIAEKVAT